MGRRSRCGGRRSSHGTTSPGTSNSRSMEGLEAPVCALADAMFRLPAKLDRLLASHGHALPRGAKEEIHLIKQDLQKMVAFLQEHDDSGADDHSTMVNCLTKEVRELSYDMEDTVDQYEHAANIRKGIAPRRKKYKVTRRRSKATSGLQEKLKWRLWMANQIREFSLRSQEALGRYSLFNHLDGNGISDPPAIGGTSSNACPRRVVSFGSWHPTPYVCMDEHVNKLEGLLGKDGEQKLKVVSVVGSGGIGKTTLAKELYRRMKGKFECRAFVRTSRKPDVRRLLVSMLSQIQPHQPAHNWQVHCLIADIRKHLQDKRYLIVIDDVWATQTWDIIVNALPDGNLCSGILITTEVDDVALKCCGYESKYVYTMKPLGHDDSSKLFFSTAFGPQHDCPPELSEVANNIIRKCDGLPLAVVTVASLLVNLMGKPEQWDYVNKSLGYGLRTNPNSDGMKQVLNLSYNNLPQHLKACVMYLSVYEESYIIWKDDLLKQWIAEGLIRATEEKDVEEISRICFDELVNSRMIQPVRINDNNDVLSCTVHRMVLDFIKHKSLKENFVTAVDHCQTTAWLADKVRRLSLHFGNAEAMPPTNMILSQVRTLAFFGVIKCLPSIVEFGYLQVLILHVWGKDESTSVDLTGISGLFRLRYLHITCNGTLELEVPQNQMRGLKNLETLKIDARVSAVPLEIVHLPGLLHLSLPVETNLPNGIGSMTSLSTLGYFDLSVNSIDNVQSLGGLTNLRDLRLTCSTVPSSCLEEKMDNMGSILTKLSNLRSATLEPSSNMVSGPSTISISCDGLSSISSPPVLQRFEWLPCICSFSSIPKWIGPLNKLCILKIGVRELTSNDVDILGGLPSLTVLSLYLRGKPAERIVITKIGFLVLKCFKFRCSAPLLGFEVGAMPNLLKLKLGFDAYRVDQLGTIAGDIMHLIGLKEISAKIGGAGAIDPCRKAAESALIDAIKMHPARPTFNIQYLDGMFSGKDDNDSRVQEEEHMTTQKQHDIMEEDSVEQHGILQKGTMEDAHNRFSAFSEWKTVGHKQADSRAHPPRRIGEIIELSSSKKWTRWLKREALKCKIMEEDSNKHHGVLQKDYRDDANKHALNRPLEGKGKARVDTTGQMAQMLRKAQDNVTNSITGRLPNIMETILQEHFAAFQSSIMGCIEDKVQSIVKTEMQKQQAALLPSGVYEHPRQISEVFPETGGITRVKLRFVNVDRPEDPLFTGCPVKWQNGENPKVAIFENNMQITQGDLSKLQIEILAVYADFFTEQGQEGFTKEEFSKQIYMCNAKESVLKTVNLTKGEAYIGSFFFTKSSYRKNLRLAARVKRQDLVIRVQEAITHPFVVKDRRSMSNEKSSIPSKEDAIHQLMKISLKGKPWSNLVQKNITKVKHLLRHYHKDKFGLQELAGMKNEDWNIMIEHATMSVPGDKIYSYWVPEDNCEILFNDFFDVVGKMTDNYVPYSVNDVDQFPQLKVKNWKMSAYKKFEELDNSGGLIPDYFLRNGRLVPAAPSNNGASISKNQTTAAFGEQQSFLQESGFPQIFPYDVDFPLIQEPPFAQSSYEQVTHQELYQQDPSTLYNGIPPYFTHGNVDGQGSFSAWSISPSHNFAPAEEDNSMTRAYLTAQHNGYSSSLMTAAPGGVSQGTSSLNHDQAETVNALYPIEELLGVEEEANMADQGFIPANNAELQNFNNQSHGGY